MRRRRRDWLGPARAAAARAPRRIGLSMASVTTSDEIRRAFTEFFVERGHLAVPSASLVPSALDQSVLADDGRHAAVQAVLPGPGDAARAAADLGAALLPRRRHRRRRLDRAAHDVLPDDGQLLVRRLLQAGRGRDGLGALDGRLRARSRAHLGDGLRGRRPARPRRRRARALARAGHPARAHRRARRGQLLEGGPDRARAARARSSTTTAAPSTAAAAPTASRAATATASSSSGTSSSWSSTAATTAR